MIVNHIYSACVVIETRDVRICCDPWFSQGIYLGAWYQFPVVENPIERIGPVDYVAISHLHLDHYDPPFLAELLKANPSCEILIGAGNQRFLTELMKRDGFRARAAREFTEGSTHVAIIPNDESAEFSIDSAIVVKDPDNVVVNLNDCTFDSSQVSEILRFAGGSPDLACLPYVGAGPYPQAYIFKDEDQRLLATASKRRHFLDLFGQYLDALEPRWAIPFAGSYFLGGRLRCLNALRGVPDAVDVREQYGSRVVVLTEGEGSIDLVSGAIQGLRTNRYDQTEIDDSLRKYDSVLYPYERDAPVGEADLVRKLSQAHSRALQRVKNPPEISLCFKCPDTKYLVINQSTPGQVVVAESVADIGPREMFFLDSRLLNGLLTRKYHWQSAEAGSHFNFCRESSEFDARVYNFLYFLHV